MGDRLRFAVSDPLTLFHIVIFTMVLFLLDNSTNEVHVATVPVCFLTLFLCRAMNGKMSSFT